MPWIPCQCCGKQLPEEWRWYVCNRCGFRICPMCIDRHQGQHGRGFKCSRCQFGWMEEAKGQGR
jgi:hypothetical protein